MAEVPVVAAQGLSLCGTNVTSMCSKSIQTAQALGAKCVRARVHVRVGCVYACVVCVHVCVRVCMFVCVCLCRRMGG